MEILVNGEKKAFEAEKLNLHDLLTQVGMDPELTGIAVAVNYSVISRSAWAETEIAAGDEVEIITARQGG